MLEWLFGKEKAGAKDEIAELRAGMAAFVKRALREEADYLRVKVSGCTISDVPVGDWDFTVERVRANEKELGTGTPD
jgi:hypothetical protein